MDRMDVSVPRPLRHEVENYQESEGYENRAQAIRALLRQGLNE